MTNTEMTSQSYIKLIIFGILSIPSLIFLVGILPSLGLVLGYFLSRRSADEFYISFSIKAYKAICYGLGVLTLIIFAIIIFEMIENSYRPSDFSSDLTYATLVHAGILIGIACHAVALAKLYQEPMCAHIDWILSNGLLSKFRRKDRAKKAQTGPEIMKKDKITGYSVADELLKWSRLKEQGVISEAEFLQAKGKLLG